MSRSQRVRGRGARCAVGALALAALAVVVPPCGGDDALTVYSGRQQDLVQPLLERFSQDTGIRIRVRFGDTAELVATILEEGGNSPADVFFAQDAGSLGALAEGGRLSALPTEILDTVPPEFRSPQGRWVGVSGRARVVAYSLERLDESDLPGSVLSFTDPAWRGRVGWAPTNGSFQAFVTALRRSAGEEAARAWLEGMAANDPVAYPNNLTAVEGVANGEVDVALVNHYYVEVVKSEQGEDYPVANHFLPGGDPGALVNVAGVGILASAEHRSEAERLVAYLLSAHAQAYFAEETFEYPLVDGVVADADLPPLSSLEPPDLDLGSLSDLQGTLALLRETGVLP